MYESSETTAALAADVQAGGRAQLRKDLRKSRKQARALLTKEERGEKSARTVRRIAESPVFREAHTVMIYAAMGAELSLEPEEALSPQGFPGKEVWGCALHAGVCSAYCFMSLKKIVAEKQKREKKIQETIRLIDP